MSRNRHYLDWNATAPLRPEARAAMLGAMDEIGNPSSVHAEGRRTRAIIETARGQVAALVGADADEVYFTSGATEANAWVLAGRDWESLATSGMEHPSVDDTSRVRHTLLIAAASDGQAAIDGELGPVLAESGRDAAGEAWVLPRPLLTSHHLANSETGVVHDVGRLAQICREARPDAIIHTDATQAAGRIAVNFKGLGVDALTLSAHKLGGPKGAGALVLRVGLELAPLIRGGGQERRLRAGTENVAAIAGFGAAAAAAARDLEIASRHMRGLRDGLERDLIAMTPAAVVVGAAAPRLPNTSCIALAGRRAEVLVAALDLEGVAVSAGAACSSGKVGPSRTLAAIGLAPALAEAAIRVSLGPTTTAADIAAFLAAWRRVTATQRRAA